MAYFRRVVKRRPASLTEAEWLEVVERGKLPRPTNHPADGFVPPRVDVYDLVFARELSDLKWRLGVLCMALLEPTANGTAGASSMSSARIGELLKPFTGLWEFLTSRQYANGKERKTGRLSLSLGSEGLKVTLTDDTKGLYCCWVAETLEDAFLALECGLADGSLKWRPSDFVKTKGR